MVDDDLEVAVRAALVLERVLDLRNRALERASAAPSDAFILAGCLNFNTELLGVCCNFRERIARLAWPPRRSIIIKLAGRGVAQW